MINKYLRYIAGYLVLALILAAFYFSKVFLLILSSVLIIITMIEYRQMFKTKEIYPHLILPEALGCIVAYIFIYNNLPKEQTYILPLIIAGTLISFAITVIRNKKPYILTTLSTIAAILLIICGLYIIKITYFFQNHYNWYLIMIYFTAVLSGDFFASQIGQRVKPIYIAPEISPNKTLAGVIANYISTLLVCLLFKIFLDFSVLNCIIIGIVVSTFSQFGDLAISTIKRDLEIKHSSTIFADYGGILDRMDSFLFSAPALYYTLLLLS
jgi:phosphatidate cytidylyltransferase